MAPVSSVADSSGGLRRRRVTVAFLAMAGVAASAAAVVGVSDHPPGIALAFLAALAAVLAVTHGWRSPRPFVRLVMAALLGFGLLVVLHNVLELGAGSVRDGMLPALMQALAIGAFILAVLIAPAAFLVGVAGTAIMTIWPPSR
jgi:lipopolysaccharide export LptBFGC system permease protein LptF